MTEDHLTYNSLSGQNSDIQRAGRIIISLIIVIYFTIVFIQVCPSGPIRDQAKAFADPIIQLFGLRQRWNLFSPNIRQMNQFATCLITYKDGSIKLYEWPENRKFSFENIERNQMRKFVVDGVNEPYYSAFWPYTAKFLARAHWNPDNPPALVEPVFNGINVPPFENYAKQNQLNLRAVDHWTVHLPYRVRSRDLSQGVQR